MSGKKGTAYFLHYIVCVCVYTCIYICSDSHSVVSAPEANPNYQMSELLPGILAEMSIFTIISFLPCIYLKWNLKGWFHFIELKILSKFELWDIKSVMCVSMYSYEYVYTQTSEFIILFSIIFSIVFHSKVFIYFEDVLRNSYIFE